MATRSQQQQQPPFESTNPATGYKHVVNTQYSDLRRANVATPEVDEYVRGALHLHMVAQVAAEFDAHQPAWRAWYERNPDVPHLDPRNLNPVFLEALILSKLEFLTPEEAFTKRTGLVLPPPPPQSVVHPSRSVRPPDS